MRDNISIERASGPLPPSATPLNTTIPDYEINLYPNIIGDYRARVRLDERLAFADIYKIYL